MEIRVIRGVKIKLTSSALEGFANELIQFKIYTFILSSLKQKNEFQKMYFYFYYN